MQRHLRLRRTEDFARLKQSGHVWRHPLLILSVTANSLTHNRYGFVTSKQLGNAVARNRIRRLLREAVRHAHPDLAPGYDVAVIARMPIRGKSYRTVKEAVWAGLHAAGLWRPKGETPP
ncbi:MAG: ribonuclease P protein component [Chloroflexi bacterium]|nr:ribonuclease P protein component [Chloroflexota bacterium]